MIPTTYAPVAAANLCTGYIPFDHAVAACTLAVIAGAILTLAAYKVGAWLRRE